VVILDIHSTSEW